MPEGRTAARLVAAAMVLGGLAALYFRWHPHLTWSPTHDGNILGTGWLLEATFWLWNTIPILAWAAVLVVLGALALHGMALPSKARPAE